MSKRYVSASKIAQFLYCPFTFELAAAGYEPVEPYLPAVASGVALHTAYRYMWFGISPEEAVEAAVAITDITMGEGIDEKEKEALLRRAKAIPQWLLDADNVEVRIEKEIPGTDIVITGYVDAIVGGMVVDIKAVTRMKNELPPTYQIQGQVYMYATGKSQASIVMLGPKGRCGRVSPPKDARRGHWGDVGVLRSLHGADLQASFRADEFCVRQVLVPACVPILQATETNSKLLKV